MNLKSDGPLSNFGFNFNLRHYVMGGECNYLLDVNEVGRCRLTPDFRS